MFNFFYRKEMETPLASTKPVDTPESMMNSIHTWCDSTEQQKTIDDVCKDPIAVNTAFILASLANTLEQNIPQGLV